MIPFILIMVLVLSLADQILTNVYLRRTKKYNIRGINNREWWEWELNPLVKRLYKVGGLTYGFVGGLVYTFVLLFLVYRFFTEEILWVILGALIVVIIIHRDNLKSTMVVVRNARAKSSTR